MPKAPKSQKKSRKSLPGPGLKKVRKVRIKFGLLSVEPKVRLQGYGYSLFCSHSSGCLEVLVGQYFEEAFCAPKVRLKWYGFKDFPLIALIALVAFFHSTPGAAHFILTLRTIFKTFFSDFWGPAPGDFFRDLFWRLFGFWPGGSLSQVHGTSTPVGDRLVLTLGLEHDLASRQSQTNSYPIQQCSALSIFKALKNSK